MCGMFGNISLIILPYHVALLLLWYNVQWQDDLKHIGPLWSCAGKIIIQYMRQSDANGRLQRVEDLCIEK